MNNKIKIVYLLILSFIIPMVSGITVDVNPNNLPSYLYEGQTINFTIDIKDINYNVEYINIETSLESINNQPIFDFKELNKYITDNRYNQEIKIKLSSLPRVDVLSVSISGKAPKNKVVSCGDGVYITKFSKTELKLYEIDVDDNEHPELKTFELKTKAKDNFEKTLQDIKWKELDGMKKIVKDMFDSGLTQQAQNIATEMKNIRSSNTLYLFKIIKVNSDFMMNLISVLSVILGIIIGLYAGYRFYGENEEDKD